MLDKGGIIFRILVEENAHTNSGAQPPSHSMGIGGSFTKGKPAGPWSYHPPQSIAEFKKECIYIYIYILYIHFFICLHNFTGNLPVRKSHFKINLKKYLGLTKQHLAWSSKGRTKHEGTEIATPCQILLICANVLEWSHHILFVLYLWCAVLTSMYVGLVKKGFTQNDIILSGIVESLAKEFK
jgi:hypothetical protein